MNYADYVVIIGAIMCFVYNYADYPGIIGANASFYVCLRRLSLRYDFP